LEILLIILFLVVGASIIYLFSFKKNKKLKFYAVGLFFLKVIIAGIFYYVYTYHYGAGTLSGDTSVFHHDSVILFDLFSENSSLFWKVITGQDKGVEALNEFYATTHYWELPVEKKPINDSRNFVRFNALVCFIGRGYYFVHTIFYVFISTWASIFFYQGILKFIKEPKFRITLLLFTAPSVLFWTSGVLKESVLFLGFGLFLYGILSIANKENRWQTHVSLLFGIILLYFFKPYVLYCLIIPTICFALCLYNDKWSKIKIYGSAVFLIFLTFIFWDKPIETLSAKQKDFINISCGEIILEDSTSYYFIDQKYYDQLSFNENKVYISTDIPAEERVYFEKERKPIVLEKSQKEFIGTMTSKQSGSYFEMAPLEGSKWTLFKNLPFAINNVIFRPFPNEKNMHIYKWLALIENISIFFLILYAWRKRVRYQHRTIKNIISFFLFFTTLLYALIGQVTPVSGAIMRYKIPGIFVLTGVIVLLLYGYNAEHEKKKKERLEADKNK
jgi:hypothetical protein